MKKLILFLTILSLILVAFALPYNPYFPITLNDSWTYSNGRTVQVSTYSEVNDVVHARISNVSNSGYVDLVINSAGVSFSSYTNPDFIMVAYTFAPNPLLKTPIVLDDTWSSTITSNGHPIVMINTITSTTASINIGDLSYDNCVELTIDFQYPDGPSGTSWLVSRKMYFYPGIGCIKRIDQMSNNSTTEFTLASHQITANEDNNTHAPSLAAYNYPNPFSQTTNISFDMPKNGNTTVSIYNMKGQLIRSYKENHLEAGINSVNWDGLDNHGKAAISGMYLYRIKTEEAITQGKMLLIK